MNCITCANWTLNHKHPMAQHGFGMCKVIGQGPWVTFAARYERDCKHHRRAPELVTDKRKEWLDAQSR